MEAKSREKPKKSAIRLCELIKEAYCMTTDEKLFKTKPLM